MGMSYKDNWAPAQISPCCGAFGNKKKAGGYRCTKCGKEWG